MSSHHLQVGHTVLLTLSSGEMLETTENHPFFVYGAGWVKAGKLCIGNLLVPRAGPTAAAVTVTGLVRKSGPTTVYNFTVQGDHSYFVGTTEGGTWVHNTCPEWTLGDVSASEFLEAAQNWLGEGYKEAVDGLGRFVSNDGLYQVRLGAHELNGPDLHGHFEIFDSSYWEGGSVIENMRVNIR